MLVSIYMIAYNEEQTIGSILADILAQTYSHADTEIVITDNNSTDGTYGALCDFRDKYIGEYRDIKILQNDSKIIPKGLNKCLDNTSGDIIVRADAHSSLDPTFVEETVACLEGTHTGIKEYACGGMRPTYAPDDSGKSVLLLAAEESRFGASAANYRGTPCRCYVNTIFHAAYRREVVEKVGHYDERLWRTEDNNYNYRVREAGYRICFEPRIKSGQQIRDSVSKMLKQKNQNGWWIGYTLGVCPKCLGVFHFVPFAFLTAVVLTSVMAAFGLGIFSALLWGAYGICNIAFSAKAIIDSKKFRAHLLLLPFLFFLMHICYGAGTYAGIFKMLTSKKK